MNPIHPGESISQWLAEVSLPRLSPLTTDLETDVCIVGGGIAGLTTAYLLGREGVRICVLESTELAAGQTGRTTAHFSHVLGHRYFELETYHGEAGARLIAESHSAAIERIEEIVRDEGIECDFARVNGYLFLGDGDSADVFAKEAPACLRAGIRGVAPFSSLPIEGFPPATGLQFPNQAELNPLKYLKRLAECVLEQGGAIHTHTHAEQIKGGPEAFVKTRDGRRVRCQSIVVATNTPINDLLAIHTKQYPYRTYALAIRIPEGSMERALYWDTADPYHYVRLAAPDVLIVGGEDHKTGQDGNPEQRYARLENWARSKFPYLGNVLTRWSGQVLEAMDGIAYLGHNPLDRRNVYVITGDSGNGMTHATIGAMLIADQIAGRENPWEHLYNPSRISLSAIPTYLRENTNAAAQYKEWFTTPTCDLEEIPRGEGAVFRRGTQFVAAYKNEHGFTQMVSAVCPHLGGIVKWNAAEKSWDCPCHGSRFDCDGKVMEGPANADLKPVEPDGRELMPVPRPDILRANPNQAPSLLLTSTKESG